MTTASSAVLHAARRSAIARAENAAPFLARLGDRFPADIGAFVDRGAAAAFADVSHDPDISDPLARLRQWRGRTALLLALGDLAGELDVPTVCRHLSDFADAVCDRALTQAFAERVPGAPPVGIAVVALGKLGSRELNYSSDIDPILIFDPETLPRRPREDPGEAAVRIGRRMVEILSARTADGHVLRVDLRLRPHPEVTPIVLPVDAAISYYESQALPWEQAAFIRSRASAGDIALGERFLAALEPFVWRRSLDFRQLGEIGTMTDRIRDHYAGGQMFGPGFDLKRGRGGIREIEFFAQVHQLIFGGRDPGLRTPATIDALAALASAGRVEPDIAAALTRHYLLFRRIEHRLQMVDDQQTHSLPTHGAALDSVAQLDGLADGAALLTLLDPAVRETSAAYDRLVANRAASRGWPRDGHDLAKAVRDAGFDPPDHAVARIAEWRSGRLRVLRSAAALAALEKVLPSLVAALAAAPEPETALARFDQMIGGLPSAINIFHLIAAEPGLARVLTRILVLAPTLADALGHRASLIEGLIDARAFDAPASTEQLLAEWRHRWVGRDYESLLDAVRDRVGELRFAYGVQLVEVATDPLLVGRGYASLAEAAMTVLADAAIAQFETAHGRVPGGELAIVALGRFGGGMLTHASDLDLVYVFTGDHLAESDGSRPLGATQYFNRLAQRVTAAVSVPTAAGKLYDVDTRLRPSGAQGPLVVSVDSFARYQREEAWSWEHMALRRARAVYGSTPARAELAGLFDELATAPRDRTLVIGEAADMRRKIALYKPATGPLDVKAGPGGLIDLEFALQVHQLTCGTRHLPAIADALDDLLATGQVGTAVVDAAALLTRMLILLRLAGPDGEPPTSAGKCKVAAACGFGDWDALLAAHDLARQHIADWWTRSAQTET